MESPSGRDRFIVAADYGGDDDNPVPLASLRQKTGVLSDCIELTEGELRWFIEVSGPHALERMGERP